MTDDDNRLDQLEQLFPAHGPHDDESIRQTAAGVAELVRVLNHATFRAPQWVATTGAVVSYLHSAAHGLNQLLDQLARAAEHQRDDPTVYDNRNRDVPGGEQAKATAQQFADSIAAARTALGPFIAELDTAFQLGSRLGNAD